VVFGDDLYALLGVPADASGAQIARAYRRRAHAAHPDTHPADPSAPARFRALTDAYDVLRDPARRAAYDRDRAVPPPARAARPLRSPARAPLWAGPVHIEPPTTTRAGSSRSTASPGWWTWLLAGWLDDMERR
jgi:curved DNA-binding protein CbpA